jgi:hypothetical protein
MRDTIEMAREAGLLTWLKPPEDVIERFKSFEALIRADEREACAKVCDDLPAPDVYSNTDKSMWDVTCVDCANAIRARGETK